MIPAALHMADTSAVALPYSGSVSEENGGHSPVAKTTRTFSAEQILVDKMSATIKRRCFIGISWSGRTCKNHGVYCWQTHGKEILARCYQHHRALRVSYQSCQISRTVRSSFPSAFSLQQCTASTTACPHGGPFRFLMLFKRFVFPNISRDSFTASMTPSE